MSDLLDDLFDPTSPPHALSVARLDALNLAKHRGRIATLLATKELPGDRISFACVIVKRAGAARMADRLRAICADASVPALNRATAAYAMMLEDVDPAVPADRLPLLAEAIVLGCALVGNAADAAAFVVAFLRARPDLTDAIVARLEPWRAAAAIPGDAVYGKALADARCAASHAAIRAAVASDPAPGSAEPDGHAWIQGLCDECGGRIVHAVVRLDGRPLCFTTHVGAQVEDSAIVALASSGTVETIETAALAWREVPIPALARDVVTRSRRGPEDERLAWLLSRYAGDAGLAEATPVDAGHAETVALGFTIADAGLDLDSLDDLVEAVIDALQQGKLDTLNEGTVEPIWRAALERAIAEITKPSRWGAPDPAALRWGLLWEALHEARDRLAPGSAAVVAPERLDGVVRAYLDALLAASKGDDEALEDLRHAVMREGPAVARLGVTPASLAAGIGAPEDAAQALAERVETSVDAVLGG